MFSIFIFANCQPLVNFFNNLNKKRALRVFCFGAGERNRTVVSCLASKRTSHCATPAFFYLFG